MIDNEKQAKELIDRGYVYAKYYSPVRFTPEEYLQIKSYIDWLEECKEHPASNGNDYSKNINMNYKSQVLCPFCNAQMNICHIIEKEGLRLQISCENKEHGNEFFNIFLTLEEQRYLTSNELLVLIDTRIRESLLPRKGTS